MTARGKVYLVGAGPGDPGLLTVRGRDLLERADVVVYDNLINERLLEWAPDAEHVFVGKSPDRHTLTQDDINRVIVELAGKHGTVVRLKGGDPFVFGRGGEEAQALRDASIPFEVVPGITAGIAAPAYAGIPVTHRNVASSVVFLTGHRNAETGCMAVPLERLALESTLIVYMGLRNLDALVEQLIQQGRSAGTPAAAIEWGTYNRQRTVTGTLETIAARCRGAKLESPVLTVIGEVVSLRGAVSWFENRPLFGRRVAVTQTRERSGELTGRLRELGAEVFEFPTVRIESEPAADRIDVAPYDWIVLTSVNGVDYLFDALRRAGRDIRALHGKRLCAISARTAEALEHHALVVDAVPEKYDAATVIASLEGVSGPLRGKRVLMPRADVGRSSIPQALREHGAEVTELRAYETVVPPEAEALADRLVSFKPNYITFGSASAARNFHRILGPDRLARLAGAVYAAIGPIASEAAEELGIGVSIVPRVHRLTELVEAIAEHARGEGTNRREAEVRRPSDRPK